MKKLLLYSLLRCSSVWPSVVWLFRKKLSLTCMFSATLFAWFLHFLHILCVYLAALRWFTTKPRDWKYQWGLVLQADITYWMSRKVCDIFKSRCEIDGHLNSGSCLSSVWHWNTHTAGRNVHTDLSLRQLLDSKASYILDTLELFIVFLCYLLSVFTITCCLQGVIKNLHFLINCYLLRWSFGGQRTADILRWKSDQTA